MGREAHRTSVTAWPRAVRQWLRKHALAPRYARHERSSVVTADGVRLALARLSGPSEARHTVVLAHGIINSSRSPAIMAFARMLAKRCHVLVPDLRGHRGSEGECTLGLLEPLDIAACVAAAPAGLPVVTVGTSLGGAAVVLHGGTHVGVAGVVAISAPAWWGDEERPGSRRVSFWVGSPLGRLVLRRLLFTRITADCRPVPAAENVVAGIAPAFTIVVHDPDDWYFGAEHAEELHGWAREPKQVWWYPGGGHGNDLLTQDFADRLLAEIDALLPPSQSVG